MSERFYPDMNIEEALRQDPRVADILADHGMDCLGCMEAHHGTLALGARLHHIELAPVLQALNALD